MRRGDIILFYYKYDPVAWLIRLTTRSNWNHIGVALHGTVIIDLRATQKRTAHIKVFLHSSIYKMKLLRIKNLTKEAQEAVINTINNEPKKRIYYKMLVKFLFMLFHIPSDICNNCAEVIARPLREHGFDICPGKDLRLITPEDFNKSDLVEDVSEELTYKEIL